MGIEPTLLKSRGWEVAPGEVISRTPASYHEFIRNSARPNFSVQKWLREDARRLVQRTAACVIWPVAARAHRRHGLSDWLPARGGVVTFFHDLSEAVAGVNQLNADYERHRRAARQLARTFLPPIACFRRCSNRQ